MVGYEYCPWCDATVKSGADHHDGCPMDGYGEKALRDKKRQMNTGRAGSYEEQLGIPALEDDI